MTVLKASGEATIRLGAAFITAVTIAVALRLATKLKTKAGLTPEDWLSILALPFFFGYQAVLMRSVLSHSGGHSLDPTELTIYQLSFFLKHLYAGEIIFVITITVVKFSVLFFYRSIFATPSFRRATTVVGTLCFLWFIAILLATIFQCQPIKAAWDEVLVVEGKGHCVPAGSYIFGYELTNVLIDICILCLPIYMIKTLQLPIRRKISVSAVFLSGGFVCVTCVVRMVYVFNPQTGEPRNLPSVMDWSTIELGSAIICACLPTYGPFIGAAGESLGRIRTWCSLKMSTTLASRSTGSRRFIPKSWRKYEDSFEELGEASSAKAESNHTTSIKTGHHRDYAAYPLESIEPQNPSECL